MDAYLQDDILFKINLFSPPAHLSLGMDAYLQDDSLFKINLFSPPARLTLAMDAYLLFFSLSLRESKSTANAPFFGGLPTAARLASIPFSAPFQKKTYL
jgi:hypothetical protein